MEARDLSTPCPPNPRLRCLQQSWTAFLRSSRASDNAADNGSHSEFMAFFQLHRPDAVREGKTALGANRFR